MFKIAAIKPKGRNYALSNMSNIKDRFFKTELTLKLCLP